jgi:anti-sigma28 factor (negative regulator of flagellin synthesis)
MKIDDRSDLSGVASSNTKAASAVDAGAKTHGTRGKEAAGTDRAEISGLAGRISEANTQDAIDRAANVERLRLEVAAGRYNPEPADIAKGIVEDALTNAASAGGNSNK